MDGNDIQGWQIPEEEWKKVLEEDDDTEESRNRVDMYVPDLFTLIGTFLC